MVVLVVQLGIVMMVVQPCLWAWLNGDDGSNESGDEAADDAGAIIAGQGEELAEEWEDNLPDWITDSGAADGDESAE